MAEPITPQNPVANPNVPQTAPARNPQGLTVAEMSRMAEIKSSQGSQIDVSKESGAIRQAVAVERARAQPGTTVSDRVTPMPRQGPEAPGSRVEARVETQDTRREASAREVARQQGIGVDQARGIYDRATKAQAGQVVMPTRYQEGLTKEGMTATPSNLRLGVTYDPRTDTYQDPVTKKYYAGFEPGKGYIFTKDEREAIRGVFRPSETDEIAPVITSETLRDSSQALNDAITRAEDPFMRLPFSSENISNQNLTGEVGEMWETALPVEAQALLQEIRTQNDLLIAGGDPQTQLLTELRDKMLAREQADITDIQAKADNARLDQEQANKVALDRAKIFFASTGALGSSQELQYVADTISGGERALRDIANAENDAIRQARNAYEDRDFELAFKQVELSEQRRQEYKQGLMDVINLKTQFEQMAMQKQQFKMQQESFAMDMDVKRMELEGKRSEAAQRKMQNLILGGQDLTAENAAEFSWLANEAGWDMDTFKGYINLTHDAVKAQKTTDRIEREGLELKNASALANLINNTPLGQSFEVNGTTYQGTGRGNILQGTETDQFGNITAWTYNPDTGETSSTNIGPYGKGADGWTRMQADDGSWWNLNTKTGQYVPVQPSDAQTTWQSVFPDGSQSPFRDSSDPYQGQCAAFTNDLYGQRILGNTFGEKQRTLSQFEVGREDVQVGDTFLMTAGDTGHVGIVSAINTDPNGNIQITALESNYVPPGGEVISTTRTMSLNDLRLKMIARVPTPNLPMAGTDSPLTSATMGTPTFGGRTPTQMLGGTGLSGLTSMQQLQARSLSTEIFGKRAGSEASNINLIGGLMAGGMALDDIKDELRYAGQSEEFTGTFRDAGEALSSRLSSGKSQAFQDTLDRHLQGGNTSAAKDYIKSIAFDTLGTEEAKKARGTDRGLDLLNEIQNDLLAYEQGGGNTGLFQGTEEDVQKKLGRVSDPEMRKVAQKIQSAIQRYRQSVSGAAFTESEAKEYKDVFPSISNTAELNAAKIGALRQVWEGDISFILSDRIGGDAYEELYKPKPYYSYPNFSPNFDAPPPGEVWVWDTESGQFGTVPEDEVDEQRFMII